MPTVKISSPDKLMFPAIGLTKAQLVAYYEQVAPLLLPHLRDRPLTLERHPDGVGGAKKFYQKNTPANYPDFIPRANFPTEDGKPVLYALGNDIDTLRYLVNQGTIAFHVWGSRAQSPDVPDYVLFDLDPGSAPFSDVVKLAQLLRETLEADGHPVFVKTSGKSGLHLLTPWKQAGGWLEARNFATEIGKRVIAKQPQLATLEIRKEKRGGRIYLDVMQNVRGHHVVPAWVVRAVPNATVSMPLRWSEVNDTLDPAHFTIGKALQRANDLGGDPLAGLFGAR